MSDDTIIIAVLAIWALASFGWPIWRIVKWNR